MSLNIQFDDGNGEPDIFQIASASGWQKFCNWASGLGESLFWLCEEGRVEDTAWLSRELTEAMSEHPPADPDVWDTAAGLAELVGIGAEDESAMVVS